MSALSRHSLVTSDFAFEIEDDLHIIRHLANVINVLAEKEHKDTEHGEEIVCLSRMIIQKVVALEDQRAKAAGQS